MPGDVSAGSTGAARKPEKAGKIALAVGRLSDPQVMLAESEHFYCGPLAIAVRLGHPLVGRDCVSPTTLARRAVVVSPPSTLILEYADTTLTAFGAQTSNAHTETLSVVRSACTTIQCFMSSAAVEDNRGAVTYW